MFPHQFYCLWDLLLMKNNSVLNDMYHLHLSFIAPLLQISTQGVVPVDFQMGKATGTLASS